MTNDPELRDRLLELLHRQHLAVLATREPIRPYLSLMAFAATEDRSGLLLATARGTRKFHNLQADARVSLLLDDRTNRADDFREALAVMIFGVAEIMGPEEKERHLPVFLAKHPHLADFASAPDTALIRVRIDGLMAVSRFQEVRELDFD